MLVLSLGLHLTIVFLFAGVFFPKFSRDVRPLYYVDLVNLPVRDPQAGRPDVRPAAEKKPEVAPTPPPAKPEPPAVPKPAPPKPSPVVVKPEPVKTVTKAPPKTLATPEPKITAEDAQAFEEKMRRLQARKEEEDFDNKMKNLAARANQQKAAAVEAPVGMPAGKGKEAGPDEQLWIQKFLKESWNLSKYQVTRRDLKAKARLVFNPGGQLTDYRIISSSGDANFDESVRNAILKAKQLPFRPGRRLELDGEQAVEFNLKDLLD